MSSVFKYSFSFEQLKNSSSTASLATRLHNQDLVYIIKTINLKELLYYNL